MSLTAGAIRNIFNNKVDGNPLVQIIDVKKISNPKNNSERYRLVISDGQHYQQSMLATQLNHMVTDGPIKEYCVIQLTEFICSEVANRKIAFILALKFVDNGPGHRIGNPSNVEQDQNAQARQQQQQNQGVKEEKQHNNNSNPYLNRGNNNHMQQPQRNNQAKREFHPIASLTPYHSRWTIKARVTKKGDMRTWSNQRGEGKLFSVDLLDKQGGQIKATMFNQTADKFYPVLQENKVFIISKGNLKLANKKYCRLPNEYELTLNDDAEIELCEEDDEIEQQRFDFASTEQIRTLAAEDFCDVIGVVTQVQPVASIVSQRTQKELVKRTITLVDQSMLAIDLTLWGSNAEKWNEDQLMNNVVACKQAKVSDYGGKSLNCSFNSQFFVNPQRDETNQLQNWYAQQGKNAQFTSLSGQRSGAGGSTERKTFGAVKDENMGMKEKPDYFNTRGTITFLKKDMEKAPWYNACPSDGCNKKVTEDQNGGFWCEKCNKNYDNFVPRYILSLMCCDSTGSQWLTAFNESAEILLGKTAHEMLQLKNAGADEAYNAVFDAANFKTYMFKIKAKAEASPEGEMRLRCTCINANPIDYVSESNYLLEQIRQAE